jgi:hypothetical protein
MKTPRDILLQRHQAAEDKLDQLRRNVVAQIQSAPTTRREPLPLRALLTLWRELFWPSRFAWGGIAAAWFLMLVVNQTIHDGGTNAHVEAAPPSPEMLQAAQAQRRMLAELADPGFERKIGRSERPRPHSRRETEIALT